MLDMRKQIIEIVRERGLLRLAEPIQLSSGQMSRDFVDGKHLCPDRAVGRITWEQWLQTGRP